MSVEEKKIETPIYGALEEAIDHMKKAYEIMNQQAVDLHREKETFESVAKKLEHVHFASTIAYNQAERRRSTFYYEPSNTDKRYRINVTRHVLRQI